ncbi:O-methyltransferase [Aspergillus indologenus CBS 114.80]|uniref:O-methyltransferase n=1 Tax=Aspergillus indologenus CBS 114.80 TaxID=1450541 RepID=A0A2V5IN03_9EURO|nr:O-methyltransferase [Aspergillus indologenus CBS 114.80]
MSSSTPLDAPPLILQLLSTLHKKRKARAVSSDILDNLADSQTPVLKQDEFDRLMLDKFIALDADKCQFAYQLLTAMGATTVVEAGTSFGVSTIYLALAVGKTAARTGTPGTVIATEKEPSKAAIARAYWAQCGPEVERVIDLREGVPEGLMFGGYYGVLALPTPKTVLPRLRRGAVVLTDNTISAAEGYKELLAFLRDPGNGSRNVALPFTGGLR